MWSFHPSGLVGPVCGGELSAPYGSINSPGYPGNYPPDRDCFWTVTVQPGLLITFAFGTLKLEDHPNCSYDFLEIRDGVLPEDPVLGKYCSTATPPPCGPLAQPPGFISTLTSLSQTKDSTLRIQLHQVTLGVVCIYLIRLPVGEKVSLNFTHMSLENHSSCSFDYVEGSMASTWWPGLHPWGPAGPSRTSYVDTPVSSGPTTRRRGITLLSLPGKVYARVLEKRIRLTVESLIEEEQCGFRPGCGTTDQLFTLAGVLEGSWEFAQPVHMCFVDLEKAYDQVPRSILWGALREYGVEGPLIRAAQSLNQRSRSLVRIAGCKSDSFPVRDGSTETDPLIGKYCGSVLPAPVRSSSNFLWIRFKSDSSVSRAGFRAAYTVACGGTFSGTGHLRSPYHPNAYPHNKNCEWVISQPEGYVVTLNFLSFDVEGGSCSYDFVEVRDGSMSSSPLLGTYCGVEIPPRLQSTQRSMYIRFTTDSSVSNHGFEAAYGSALEGCGDTLTSPSGTITSPGHPSIYPHGANCTWYITVSPGNLVQLVFESFNLEYHTNCNFDYVEVYDNGTVQTGSKLGRYCGRSVPPSITSTDNQLTLLFVSDTSLATEGFSASYVSIDAATDCSETFTSPTGSFSSPNYPNYYPNNRDCIFKIIVEVNMQIMLNFSSFSLEGSTPSCYFDFVEIRDGGYETSPLIGKFCGSDRPPAIVSHSNRLWVKFHSDSAITYGGFTAHWDGTQTGCGGTLTTASGGFSSPNYPLPYHPNAECYWTIRTSQGNQLHLSFSDFHLESSASCSYDYLAVYDGSSDSAPQLGRLCGSQQPSTINSTGNQLYIKLRTDSSVAAGGFLASYSTECSNVLVSGRYRGVVESLNFPRNYPASAQCSWTIQATTGNTINYTFTAFQLEGPASSCVYDYVKVNPSFYIY
ncbi:Cubilin Precursor [Takifugu flavidus]|uniref:Cubilin n=1 Tax=Takifugu flavidus TaxID=433684 RepID=A0A5C6NVF0_9TELE|nr:Cubilin Precursor [Takifugu flavidus]